jgi:hypothetical protein
MFCKNKQRPDGLHVYCKSCRSAIAAKKYLANRESYLERNKKWQRENPDKKNALAREYRAKNKDAVLDYHRSWREQNREKVNAYTAKWRDKVGNERVLEDARRYREANRDKTRAAALRWQKENAGKANAANAARYASKLRATPGWADMDEITEFYEDAERLSIETGMRYEVDHIVPLRSKIVCGLHCEANLRVVLAFDNRSKGNRHWPDMP